MADTEDINNLGTDIAVKKLPMTDLVDQKV